jgi:hypothetical protein
MFVCFGLRQAPVHFRFRRRLRRTRFGAAFRRRHPARDECEGFGGADGAMLVRVDLFAVVTQSSHSQLHAAHGLQRMCLAARRRRGECYPN